MKSCFVCKLLGPRPTFPMDMTPEEAKVVQDHVTYWRDFSDRGIAIVFGPVADPAGIWGLGVVEATSLGEVEAIRDNDPVTKSGLGFRMEIYPMISSVVRK